MRNAIRNGKRGSALLVTLGLLAIASALVFAFALSARTERIAARRGRESVCAAIDLDTSLAIAMAQHLPFFLRHYDPATASHYPPDGKTSSFDRWLPLFDEADDYCKPSVITPYGFDHEAGTITNLLWNSVTNYLPAALLPQLEDCSADWIPIQVVDENSDDNDVLSTNVLLAYAIIDLSGFLDANLITSNQVDWLERNGTDIADGKIFLEDRLRQTAPGPEDLPDPNGYVSVRDLALRNRGIKDAPTHLLHYSYDAAPDVTSTGIVVYGSNQYGERFSGYLPKFDLNSWTNGFHGDLDDPGDLERHYASDDFRDGWLDPVTNRLAWCGFAAAEEIAWNLVNFMDGDKIPQGPHGLQWREPWPVEDVPLINEIAVAQVPPAFGYTNSYAAAVELWYPFATNSVTEDDEAMVVMAVYTNWPPDPGSLSDPNWTNDIIFLPDDDAHGFTVSNAIGKMECGTSSEFHTFTIPEPYVSFPVSITRLSTTGSGPLYRPTPEDGWSRVEPATGNADGRYLETTTFNLPIGIQTYSTYVKTDEPGDFWERETITVTNEIRLITRVMLKGRWVDEAMAYVPDDDLYGDDPYPFREPCGFEVNDPRRNGHFDDWVRYKGETADAGPETGASGTEFGCTLSGATNAVCDPWHEYGQGLPVVHYDSPLRRAGDIGYIHEPYSRRHGNQDFSRPYDDDRIETNDWQSICLADARILNITNNYSFSAGSVLEFFTVRAATNSPVRGLVNVCTPWPAVVGATLADIEVGTGPGRARLDDAGISWMTNVFFDIQQELFSNGSIPVGVGDFCMGAGRAGSYKAADAIDDARDDWHWRDSLGNDSKEDILRELCERLSFRQQIYGVYLIARATTPAMTIGAQRRALVIVLRDAYTGAWRILNWIDL